MLEFPGPAPKTRKTKEKAIYFLCIVDAASDPNSDGYWMKLSQGNQYRDDTLKERRDDALPFIPKAVVATVVNAATPNVPQIPTIKQFFRGWRGGWRGGRRGRPTP
jgi:hypothetical protein